MKVEKIIEKNNLKIDKDSLKRIDKTIKVYKNTSPIRFKKSIDELELVKKHIKSKL